MKRILILMGMMLVLLSVFASASFLESWGEYQDYSNNFGFVSDQQGNWNSSGYSTTSKITDGISFQPLAVDVDNDSYIEIIGSDGNYLKIWEYSSDVLSLDDEENMNSGMDVQPIIIPDFDNNGYPEIAAIFNDVNITIFEYNNSGITRVQTNTTNSYSARSGIRCLNYTGVDACFWLAWNGTNCSVMEYNVETNQLGANMVGSSDCSTTNGKYISPPLADIDRDGSYELVFAADYDDNGDEGIIVWDITSGNLDTSFSSDGIFDDLDADSSTIAGLMISNVDADASQWESCIDSCLDTYPNWYDIIQRAVCVMTCNGNYDENVYGGGDSEIVITYYMTGGIFSAQDSVIRVCKADGSTLWSATVLDEGGSTETTKISAPVTQDIDNDDDWDICVVGVRISSTTNDFSLIRCYEDSSNTITYNYQTGSAEGNENLFWNSPVAPTMADIDDDSNYEMLLGGYYFNLDNSGTLDNVSIIASPEDYEDAFAIPVDVTLDGSLDICAMESGNVYCSKSTFTNSPPELNNTYDYGGYAANYDYTNPICLDTTLIFEAQETGGNAEGNYDNDVSTDEERLVSNCGYDSTHVSLGTSDYTTARENGTYALSNPDFSCVYNNTGNYRVRIYIQDKANDDDYSQYNTQIINIQVVNGTPGVTCNLGSLTIDELSGDAATSAEEQTNEAVEGTFDELFGTGSSSDKLKIIVGLAIVIGIIVAAVKAGVTNGIVIAGIGIIATIMVTFMGLIPVSILLTVMAGLILIIFIGKAIMGGESQGGG